MLCTCLIYPKPLIKKKTVRIRQEPWSLRRVTFTVKADCLLYFPSKLNWSSFFSRKTTFLRICRKHIFWSIVLEYSTTHAFEHLLRVTPDIADYIRKLVYNIWIANPSILDSLRRISRLEFLTIWHLSWPRLNWSNNLICPALLYLFHLPTLNHFKATNINDFVVSDLLLCVNLKYLDIGNNMTVAAINTFHAALPEHSIQLNEFVAGSGISASVMKLCAARRPVILLRTYFVSGILFLIFPCSILVWDPQNARPSLADMLRPSMQTFEAHRRGYWWRSPVWYSFSARGHGH